MNSKTLPSDLGSSKQTGVDYWLLFQDLPDAYLIFEASDPDYTIVDANHLREKMTGISREDCIGRKLFEIFPYTQAHFMETAGKDLRKHLLGVIRTGRPYKLAPVDSLLVDDDGVKRPIYVQATYSPLRDSTGKVRHILASTRIVTDELQAIERVVTAESRLAAALTIGKVGSWVFDVTTQRIIGDDNFKQLFKMPEKRARIYNLELFLADVHEDDRAHVATTVRQSLKRHTPFEVECRVEISDGTQHWILARGQPEDDTSEGTPSLFSGVVVDLTEQRNLRAQVELARQQDRLNRQAARALQQRNEELEAIGRSKDEFVALASHQLRTPATAVKQYLGMVLQGYVGDINDDQTDVLTKAFESNERQIQIINQILSAARADTGRLVMMPIPVDLRSLVQGISADLEALFAQRQHVFDAIVPDKPVRVSADLGYLRMAIENILHNASVYTPAGGSITVRLSQTAKRCKLTISDTGVGIKKADLGRLFVKFSRIHNPLSVEAGGSGIGLYLSAEIVRLHGGEISVDSQAGKGSTFAISLPLMQNESVTKEKK